MQFNEWHSTFNEGRMIQVAQLIPNIYYFSHVLGVHEQNHSEISSVQKDTLEHSFSYA